MHAEVYRAGKVCKDFPSDDSSKVLTNVHTRREKKGVLKTNVVPLSPRAGKMKPEAIFLQYSK